MRLTRKFFARPTLDVAHDLVGSTMNYNHGSISAVLRIVEVEAYIGEDDPACHAAAGRTARTEIMYGEPGHAYVYFIYGMYYCLNVVTEKAGSPAAVLIRAAEPISGIDNAKSLSGPGKLCQTLGITKVQHGLSMCSTSWHFDRSDERVQVATSQRIGITKGVEQHWRFYDVNSSQLSGPKSFNTMRSEESKGLKYDTDNRRTR